MRPRLIWPSAESGSLVAQGGVMAAYRREIEAAPDPVARRLEIEARFQRMDVTREDDIIADAGLSHFHDFLRSGV